MLCGLYLNKAVPQRPQTDTWGISCTAHHGAAVPLPLRIRLGGPFLWRMPKRGGLWTTQLQAVELGYSSELNLNQQPKRADMRRKAFTVKAEVYKNRWKKGNLEEIQTTKEEWHVQIEKDHQN